ncbi:hypothetical protein [Actinomadura citrea]|uniref:Uncharacterized protein n=1 Tax=Actinomadura citrea TaxID=46158 RepID=A0A7Y9KA11_9ACTN|nr:hypothetical protein [Actinomadura citrea]NYE09835.1 hypothetical protein [Actinomadura citrea]GGT63739.1 hypothetical protein GCM10010177_21090 [Actinomadura citrea]
MLVEYTSAAAVEENVWTAVRTGAHVALGFSSLPADQYVEFDQTARDPDVGVIAAGSFSSMAAALIRAAAMAPNIRANGRLSTTPARPSRTRLYSSATAFTRQTRVEERKAGFSEHIGACSAPARRRRPSSTGTTRNMQGPSRSPVPASRPQRVKGTST